jgi:hypothetical protein
VDIIHSDVPVREHEEARDGGEGIPITDAARSLNQIGGVGATLRYTLEVTAPSERI